MTVLDSAEIICFAATKNPEIARQFYEEILELSLIEDSPFALVFDAHGAMLRIQKVQEHTPAKHTVLGWKVSDIKAEIKSLSAKGITFQSYDRLQQDNLGIWLSPSGALVAWFLDPDGNGLSITQFPARE